MCLYKFYLLGWKNKEQECFYSDTRSCVYEEVTARNKSEIVKERGKKKRKN